MKNKFHFISGLPRSGSTMLAAILKQNPRFVAGMTSPLATLFKAMEDATAKRVETSVFVTDEQRDKLLKGLFSIYYAQHRDQVIFDTSRMWCARLTILSKLFPDSKFICCVRDVRWIVDSFERIYRKNEQKPSGIYGFDTSGTVYSRTMNLASSNGIVGYAMDALREACASEQKGKIMLIDYEQLCQKPHATIKELYNFIGEEEYPHNFNKVEFSAGEFDSQLAVPGLHEVKGAVEWRPRETILPQDLFNRFANDNFWKKPEVLSPNGSI